jgi:hypothetical protein
MAPWLSFHTWLSDKTSRMKFSLYTRLSSGQFYPAGRKTPMGLFFFCRDIFNQKRPKAFEFSIDRATGEARHNDGFSDHFPVLAEVEVL